jgi:hypothetical protein
VIRRVSSGGPWEDVRPAAGRTDRRILVETEVDARAEALSGEAA